MRRKLGEIEGFLGIGRLDVGGGSTRDEKQRAKDRKVVIESLAAEIPVHPAVLDYVGLTPEPNPPTNYEDDGGPPF